MLGQASRAGDVAGEGGVAGLVDGETVAVVGDDAASAKIADGLVAPERDSAVGVKSHSSAETLGLFGGEVGAALNVDAGGGDCSVGGKGAVLYGDCGGVVGECSIDGESAVLDCQAVSIRAAVESGVACGVEGAAAKISIHGGAIELSAEGVDSAFAVDRSGGSE